MGFFLVLALVFWLLPAFITAYLADEKGRSAAGWFLFAFFFGFIALILVIVLGPGEGRRQGGV